MPTVLKTFVQATYVMATFVHISNISAVTGPIFTKLFGSKFLEFIIFVGQNVLGPNIFRPKFFSDTNFFPTQNPFRDQRFWTSKFIGHKKFSNPKFLFQTQFFSKIFSDTKSIGPNIFWTHNFFGPKVFRPKIVLDPWFFSDQIFVWDFHWRRGIEPFQAEHFRLKSCFSSLDGSEVTRLIRSGLSGKTN